MWSHHDRLDQHINEVTCRQEIESFVRHGQLVPVLGRPLKSDPEFDVELIYGARRLFVARHINRPILVELRDLSDREAIIAMDIENRHRLDISPYERGLSYARWLRAGYFQSQEEIARALKVSASQVSRVLQLARLPSAILNAFGNVQELCEGWGRDLTELLEDPVRREPTLRKARALAALVPRLPAREVYQRLMSASVQGRKPRCRTHDEVVKDRFGKPLFRIRQLHNTVAVLLPMDTLSAESLQRIRSAVGDVLQSARRREMESRVSDFRAKDTGVRAAQEHSAA